MNIHELNKIILEKLESNNEQLSKQFFFQNIYTSTKYFILDDLLPEEVALDICENFPNKDICNFLDTFRERKFTFCKT